VVVASESYWERFFNVHLAPFALEFGTVLKNHGIDMNVVQMGTSYGYSRDVTVGRAAIADKISSLGDLYRGALIVTHYDRVDDMAGLSGWLLTYGRPVVWLDHDNTAPQLDRRRISKETYFRCYSDEDAVVNLAVQHLRALGHRHIGYPELVVAYESGGWITRRAAALKRAVERCSGQLDLVAVKQGEQLWNKEREAEEGTLYGGFMLEHLDALYQKLRSREPRASNSRIESLMRAELVRELPSLARLAFDSPVTAVVALNQRFATSYYYWFRQVDVSIPQDLSLITFDNRAILGRHPITTIDLCLESLGYKAAHVLVGDIPIKADRWGNIVSTPCLAGGCSVGPPRKAPTLTAAG
jgi:hypothetical protein